MGAKSDFQLILEEIIDRQAEAVKPRDPCSASPRAATEDFFSKISFGDGNYRVRVFGDVNKAYGSCRPPRQSQSPAQTQRQTQPQTWAPRPQSLKPRTKRKFTVDQLNSIKVFIKFGEIIDDHSTDDEIKAAYRRLAKRFHPDTGAQNADPFKKISAAYRKFFI